MWRLAIYEYHEYWVFTNYNGYYIRLDFGRLLDSVLSMQCVAAKFEVSEYLLSYRKDYLIVCLNMSLYLKVLHNEIKRATFCNILSA